MNSCVSYKIIIYRSVWQILITIFFYFSSNSIKENSQTEFGFKEVYSKQVFEILESLAIDSAAKKSEPGKLMKELSSFIKKCIIISSWKLKYLDGDKIFQTCKYIPGSFPNILRPILHRFKLLVCSHVETKLSC